MIIIEGSDLVGKTVLAKRLASKLDTHVYQHLSKPPAGFDPVGGYVELSTKCAVFDRFHISGPVYNKIDRSERCSTNAFTNELVEAHLRIIGAYTVVVTAHSDLISNRYGVHDEEMFGLKDTLSANKRFIAVAKAKGGYCLQGYRFNVDRSIHCDNSCPFVYEDMDDVILNEYYAKQELIRRYL